MNKTLITRAVIAFIIVCFAAGIYFISTKKSGIQNIQYSPVTTSPVPTLSTQPTVPTTTPMVVKVHPIIVTQGVYQNQYMKVTIPTGWTATEGTVINSYGERATCTSTPSPVEGMNYTGLGGCQDGIIYFTRVKTELNPSAVNITKGNYILYINARVGQASGVEGGRFEEYAGGSPSVDAVILEHPGGPCGTSNTNSISLNATSTSRTDFYLNASDKTETCATPTNGQTVWYFSDVGRGINYYNIPNYYGPAGWVITMAYKSKVINSFPVKDGADLNQALSQMTDILKTLTINPPVPYVPSVSQTINAMSNISWTSSFSESVNGGVISCTDTSSTHSINQTDVAMSYHMESYRSTDNTTYTSTDIPPRINTIEGMLVNDGWSKCNHIFSGSDVVDVYQKNKELVNVATDASVSSMQYILLTFFKLK